MYNVVVIEDLTTRLIVGTATLVIEQKFIRSGAKCGHIEDVVVDEKMRGHGLGKVLVLELLKIAKALRCYKVVLTCSNDNVRFY